MIGCSPSTHYLKAHGWLRDLGLIDDANVMDAVGTDGAAGT